MITKGRFNGYLTFVFELNDLPRWMLICFRSIKDTPTVSGHPRKSHHNVGRLQVLVSVFVEQRVDSWPRQKTVCVVPLTAPSEDLLQMKPQGNRSIEMSLKVMKPSASLQLLHTSALTTYLEHHVHICSPFCFCSPLLPQILNESP